MFSKKIRSRNSLLFTILGFTLMFFFVADLMLGSVSIPVKELIKVLFTGNASVNEWKIIVIDFRLPKAIAAILAGIALSISGLQMQTIFRNPLAGPYVLGISSGASLGVAILVLALPVSFLAGFHLVAGNWSVVIASWIGAGLTLMLILFVSSRVRDIMTILILGIMIGSAISAIVSILQYFGNEAVLKSFVIWTMGSLGHISYNQLNVLIPCIVLGVIVAIASAKKLDALLLGERYAISMGLNIKPARFIIFLSTSILAGSITAFCGPIGFIGIVVPHICRILFKTSVHKLLIIASCFVGAIIMLLSDILSQLPGTGYALPINSITAIMGIPVVIWIIIRNQRIENVS
jgi:iron complex transport system permease protein